MTVDEVRPCPWCRQTLPLGHPCVGDDQVCGPGEDCGICHECLTRQAFDLAVVEDMARYGTPSDLPEVGA